MEMAAATLADWHWLDWQHQASRGGTSIAFRQPYPLYLLHHKKNTDDEATTVQVPCLLYMNVIATTRNLLFMEWRM